MSGRNATDTAELDGRSRYAFERQEAIYDGASGLIWRKAVYERLHGGWELANLGGLPFLDSVVRMAHLGRDSSVLELGSGAGAACQYLVRSSGCRATGIERNGPQMRRAIVRTAASPEAGRLTFLSGDIVAWRPGDQFDVAFLLDTLSLLPNPVAALRTAAFALAAGGHLFLADLGAGPGATSSVLECAFTEDGFCSLLSIEEMKALLADAGFANITVRHRTGQARRGLSSIMEWLDNPPAAIRAVVSDKALADWREVSAFYLEAFESRALEYRWWSARPIRARTIP